MWGRRPHDELGFQGRAAPWRGNQGVSPEVFWSIAKKHGVKVPAKIPLTV